MGKFTLHQTQRLKDFNFKKKPVLHIPIFPERHPPPPQMLDIFSNLQPYLPAIPVLHNARKVSKYDGVFSGTYFPAFGLNTERYKVENAKKCECRKIRTRKISVFG